MLVVVNAVAIAVYVSFGLCMIDLIRNDEGEARNSCGKC